MPLEIPTTKCETYKQRFWEYLKTYTNLPNLQQNCKNYTKMSKPVKNLWQTVTLGKVKEILIPQFSHTKHIPPIYITAHLRLLLLPSANLTAFLSHPSCPSSLSSTLSSDSHPCLYLVLDPCPTSLVRAHGNCHLLLTRSCASSRSGSLNGLRDGIVDSMACSLLASVKLGGGQVTSARFLTKHMQFSSASSE